MKDRNKQHMYKLFRELGDSLGIARMTIMALESFINSIRQLKCSKAEVETLYLELADAVKHAQPNIIPLMHLLEQFETEMSRVLKPEMTTEEIGHAAISSLQEKIQQFQNNAAQVTENGLHYIGDNDVIIVHSASSVVTNILVKAKKKLERKFSVIILDHNPVRTRQTIELLREAYIDHIVAPAHNLSHHIENANKMFVGAMTITADRQIVAPTGTATTVSLCHFNRISVHLFANSLHYSHRSSEAQSIYRGEKNGHSPQGDFSITTHSHDLVNLDLIDHVITEKGETDKTEKRRNIKSKDYFETVFTDGNRERSVCG